MKGALLLIEYFAIFYILIINNLKIQRLIILKNILFVSSSLILIIAFIQEVILDGDPYLVRGLFENRNILGPFLCLMVPLIYVELLHTSQTPRKVWMGLLLILSFIVLTSGSAVLSLLISLFIINFLSNKKILLRFIIVVLLASVFYPFIMPQRNVKDLKEFTSIFEQGSINKNYYRWLTFNGNFDKNIVAHTLKPIEIIGLSVLINNNTQGNVIFSILNGTNNWEGNSAGISKLFLKPEQFYNFRKN